VLVVDNADQEAISSQQSGSGRETELRASSHDLRTKSIRFLATNTMMRTLDDKRNLAAFLLEACEVPQSAKA
jgi:hypothetical protein